MKILDEDMIGKKFNRLTVIEKSDIKGGDNRFLWKCICDCQQGLPKDKIKYTYTTKSALIRGIEGYSKGVCKSCGCLREEKRKDGSNKRKYNKYDVESYDYGIGWTNNGLEFYFDLEDYELIKQYCWHEHTDGYLRTCISYYIDENNKRHNKYIMMHQLIMNTKGVDHIDGNPKNNRRSNLRETTHNENMKNMKLPKDNTSGHKGVYLTRYNTWNARIHYNKMTYNLGTFINYEDAVKVREEAERKYYGELNRAKEFL